MKCQITKTDDKIKKENEQKKWHPIVAAPSCPHPIVRTQLSRTEFSRTQLTRTQLSALNCPDPSQKLKKGVGLFVGPQIAFWPQNHLYIGHQ